jgi:hypothetical protein
MGIIAPGRPIRRLPHDVSRQQAAAYLAHYFVVASQVSAIRAMAHWAFNASETSRAGTDTSAHNTRYGAKSPRLFIRGRHALEKPLPGLTEPRGNNKLPTALGHLVRPPIVFYLCYVLHFYPV